MMTDEPFYISGSKMAECVVKLEAALLAQMEDGTPSGYDIYGFPFKYFVDDVFHRDLVRGLLRGLTDKGLAYYAPGLFTEDGEVAGSGYGITQKGRQFLKDFSPAHYCPAERMEKADG